MYYAVNVDHNSMIIHVTEVSVKGFKKCYISNTMNGWDWSGYVVEWQ
jgi:hypothetical protein